MNKKFLLFFGLVLILSFVLINKVFAQDKVDVLSQKIESIENYVKKFQPLLLELSDSIDQKINLFSEGVEKFLNEYVSSLNSEIDRKFDVVNNKIVVLSSVEKDFKKIETNVGNFFIAVQRIEALDNGYRLHLSIGNPYYAEFSGFKIRLFWGEKLDEKSMLSYNDWRKTLKGAEFTFKSRIKRGKWNNFYIDINDVVSRQLEYLEFKMEVLSVELEQDEIE